MFESPPPHSHSVGGKKTNFAPELYDDDVGVVLVQAAPSQLHSRAPAVGFANPWNGANAMVRCATGS